MFKPEVYSNRRNALRKEIKSGILIFPGNSEAPFNYPSNTYYYRQDSNFSYFFGLGLPDLAAIIDIDNNTDTIYGNNVDIDDIIWMGQQPSISDLAKKVDVIDTKPLEEFKNAIKSAIDSGRKVHFTPPYRNYTKIQLSNFLDVEIDNLKTLASIEMIKGIVKLRSIKSEEEVKEIEKMVNVAYLMHTTAMKMAKPGVIEKEIAGTIEGIALANAGPVSFPVILSVNGQTLHNHYHGNTLEVGRMMVTDAGCESAEMLYASDITRTVPVGGKFNKTQKDIYNIVLEANVKSIEAIKPNVTYREIHFLACKIIAHGLKNLNLMKGNIDKAVEVGAHALFMPHGLGHMLGLDVHDMEGLGENFVGYDDEVKRSDVFGTAFLRLGRKLQKGFVLTVEPGIYFIPALIDQWKNENKFVEFINYKELEKYRYFGGIRIEDDILVTENGCKVLGKHIPKTVEEIEELMQQ